MNIGQKVKREGVRGVVIGTNLPSNVNMCAVEWDDGTLEKVYASDLTEVNSELEADYAEIQNRLNKAAQELREANILAEKHGRELGHMGYDYDTDEELIDYSDLFQQLRDAGWSTSSMRC